MGKRSIYILVALLLFTTSCRNYICPAYESTFNRGETPLAKYFTFLPTDTLAKDDAQLSAPKFFAYFDKDSAFIPTGEKYARARIETQTDSGAIVIKHANTSFFKKLITNNRQKNFRVGREKNKKTGLGKKRFEDVVALNTPRKGRKFIERRNHAAVVRAFPVLPLPEIVVIDTPTLDIIDEPFLVVDEDSLLLDLKPEETDIIEEEVEKKASVFPPANFDQWYYEQEFGYLLHKNDKKVSLDSLGMEENQLGDSLGIATSKQKGIKGFFKKITSKFKKKDKEGKVKKEKKPKKKLSFKNPFKKKKKGNGSEGGVQDEDGVFDSEDLEDIGASHDDDIDEGNDDDIGDDGGG